MVNAAGQYEGTIDGDGDSPRPFVGTLELLKVLEDVVHDQPSSTEGAHA